MCTLVRMVAAHNMAVAGYWGSLAESGSFEYRLLEKDMFVHRCIDPAGCSTVHLEFGVAVGTVDGQTAALGIPVLELVGSLSVHQCVAVFVLQYPKWKQFLLGTSSLRHPLYIS